ncbi:MAG: large ribosomal subunit protein bL35 [Anaerolineae bacterium]
MPKIKTHQATAKRFRRSKGGKGKLMRTRQGKSHLRRKKPKDVKREYDEMHVVKEPAIKKRVKRLAPYLHKKD